MPTRKVPEADEDGRLGTMPQGATIFAITAIGYPGIFFFFCLWGPRILAVKNTSLLSDVKLRMECIMHIWDALALGPTKLCGTLTH